LVKGSSFRDIGKRFGLAPATVHRHMQHARRAAVRTLEEQPEKYGESVLNQLDGLAAKAERLLAKAEGKGDIRAALAAIRELRETLAFKAKLQGEVVERHAHLHLHEQGPNPNFLRHALDELPTDLRQGMDRAMHHLLLNRRDPDDPLWGEETVEIAARAGDATR